MTKNVRKKPGRESFLDVSIPLTRRRVLRR